MTSIYNDGYPSCKRTYATLRVYFDGMSGLELNSFLGIDATRFYDIGDELGKGKCIVSKQNGWFYSSKNIVDSKDLRKHLDFLVEKFMPVKEKLNQIKNEGAKIDISCFWLSKSGNGGPTISQNQFQNLSKFGVDLWIDFY